MRIDISLSTKALKDRLAKIERELPNELDTALFATAQMGEAIILDRTEKGQGIKGAFAPYSILYAKAKREGWPKTRNRSAFSGDPSGVVNLNVTGEMTSSMVAKKGRGYAEIKFSKPSAARKAYFNNKTRPFFGFSRGERQRLVNYFKKRLFK